MSHEFYGYGVAVIWLGLYWMSWCEARRLKAQVVATEKDRDWWKGKAWENLAIAAKAHDKALAEVNHR